MEKRYEEITVFELQELYETDITANIRLDGDRKTVYINTLNISLENCRNALVQAFEPGNEINKIVANNKDPYTYARLLQVINEHRKEK